LEGGGLDEKERAVAQWAFDHGRPSGWSTDTLPAAEGLYIPLKGNYETVGVLAYRPATSKSRLSQEEYNMLTAVAQQLAVSMERQRLYQTILHSVSHEMHTPLTAVMGNASALQNEQIAANEKSRHQLLQELAGNADRLNRVVVNLLDMSRLSAGTVRLKKDWHDVGDLISIALEKTKKALAGHQVIVKNLENLPLVRVDFYLFEQALANLLLNAATYTPPGTTIEISVQVTEDQMELVVSDTGPGVPEQAMPHLFNKFYRVEGSQPGGTGLGLAIVKGVVDAHGGTVAVHSRPGGGLSFLIRLPVERQPETPADSTLR
jgi:two-component system sensor histidine kinase KdpD